VVDLQMANIVLEEAVYHGP